MRQFLPATIDDGEVGSFYFEDSRVRFIGINGEPWLVAKDVCDALGIGLAGGGVNPVVRPLDDDEKTVLTKRSVMGSPVAAYFGKAQMLTFISESGFYRLIFRSRKPTAERFTNWVCKDVLPSIVKDDSYVTGQERITTGEMSAEEFVNTARAIVERKLARIRADQEKGAVGVFDLSPGDWSH